MNRITMQRLPTSMLLAATLAVVLTACSTTTPAPVVDRTARPAPVAPPARPAPAPTPAATPTVTPGSQFYVVQKGDTLFGVARAHRVEPAVLAGWNGLAAGAGLREGQVLRVVPPLGSAPAVTAPGTTVSAAPATGAIQGQPLPPGASAPSATPSPAPSLTPVTVIEAPLKREPKAQRLPYSEAALASLQRGETTPGVPAATPQASAATPAATAPAPTATPTTTTTPPAAVGGVDLEVKPGNGVDRDGVTWSWPAAGRVVSKFNDKAAIKGIDIAVAAGTAIVAAATGKVIYVGKEVRGSGQMIVVSHGKGVVSVYFPVDRVQVKEEQRVLLGQKLADGVSGSDARLHFEVRRQGQPVDPVSLMPAR